MPVVVHPNITSPQDVKALEEFFTNGGKMVAVTQMGVGVPMYPFTEMVKKSQLVCR